VDRPIILSACIQGTMLLLFASSASPTYAEAFNRDCGGHEHKLEAGHKAVRIAVVAGPIDSVVGVVAVRRVVVAGSIDFAVPVLVMETVDMAIEVVVQVVGVEAYYSPTVLEDMVKMIRTQWGWVVVHMAFEVVLESQVAVA
jgi:hypothetical protein